MTDTNKNCCVIRVTAFTRDAIVNLLERISSVKKNYDFTIKNLKKDGLKHCIKGEDLSKEIANCNKPIVIGGPIIKNSYPAFPSDHLLIFGLIQQCLMQKDNGFIVQEKDLKERKHDFGPLTIQLKENWRINKELNSFFQRIYGAEYISKNPNIKLDLDDQKLLQIDDLLIRRILSPDSVITLIKLKISPKVLVSDNSDLLSDQSKIEADVNIALSRVKSKLIIITTDKMLNPNDIEIFTNKKISEGLKFLHMVKNWVEGKTITGNNEGIGIRPREDDNSIIE
ncbi:hypothetical protein C1645_829252 [Glomus cerebriforme]|uniref:P-loop containing nucleoside triphosphate hydrolase protein n=1 Tax=Glomus cerebriforme TaxID=658196 RepID=A0A397SPD8_9GLOM|nr:hypothetical protein C1645_829252 [Glomus cerebriforme]